MMKKLFLARRACHGPEFLEPLQPELTDSRYAEGGVAHKSLQTFDYVRSARVKPRSQ